MNHQGRLRAWARAGIALAVAVAGSAALAAPPAQAAEGPVVVSLTFDDGLLNQYQLAPLLAAQGVPATFYVNSGEINTGGTMSWDQTRELAAAGHEIGGHTLNHQRIGGASPVIRSHCGAVLSQSSQGRSRQRSRNACRSADESQRSRSDTHEPAAAAHSSNSPSQASASRLEREPSR